MVTPLSTNTTSLLPDTASVSVKAESTSFAAVPSQSVQSDKTGSSLATAKDTVDLSSTARNMSKSLNGQENQDQKVAAPKSKPKQQAEQPLQTTKSSYTATLKHYPPFMGNANELKMLKETSPALYREILRMIVPPPVDISYADAQILRNAK